MVGVEREFDEQPVGQELDLSSLRNAVLFYQEALKVYRELIDVGTTATQRELLRSGLIQTFETTYELCWKYMKRWLETNLSPDEASGVNRRELYRICAENLLIDDVNQWMEFHQARNRTSHIYNETVAEEVFSVASRFLPYAQDCLKQLEERS
ncbi:MAG: nucleotidyltransferase substrate binding protein [Candidatus Adiutrix sp.]|jgi:nucleotidyltransferase substrate binding protein (TIGR01987 family)|nr:nucleotidyltransferase substrate binding protein [Candidatus Adiutrix sp.]